MKTLVYTTSLQENDAVVYKYDLGETSGRETKFPMNSVIASKLSKDDEVRIVILKSTSDRIDADKAAKECLAECEGILSEVGCKVVEVVEIPVVFDGESENIKDCYVRLMKALECKTEIYLDMTYGPKYLPFVAFASLNYSEKFFASNVRCVFYGKVLFGKDKKVDKNSGKLFDLTSVYRLNSLCVSMKGSKESFNFLLEEMFV